MPKQIYLQDSNNESTRMLAAVINKDKKKKNVLVNRKQQLM